MFFTYIYTLSFPHLYMYKCVDKRIKTVSEKIIIIFTYLIIKFKPKGSKVQT